jgi:16S rRNA (guanine527-N7)-methyltransferase
VLDLGTGGGLPGIPLKILLPQTSFTLLDSTGKKIKVVQQIIRDLSLEDVTAVWGRAEDLGMQSAYHKRYDTVVARGVGSLRDLVRWSWPFLRSGDRGELRAASEGARSGSRLISVEPPALVALKGGDLDGEIRSAKTRTGIRMVRVIDLRLRGAVQLEEGEKKIVLVNF